MGTAHEQEHEHGGARAWVPPEVRRRRWALGLLVAGGVLVAAGLGLRRLAPRDGFQVPRPAQSEALAPGVRAEIEAHVSQADAHPRDAQALALLGLLYATRGFPEEALQCYRRAEELAPDEPLWPYHAALAELAAERVHDGRDALARVAQRWPQFAPGRFRLGVTALDLGDFELAQRELAAATELAPTSSEARAALGDALLQGGDAIGAARELERALQLDPQHASARHMLGLALQRSGEPEAQQLPSAGGAARRLMGDAWSDRGLAFLQPSELLERALERLAAGDNASALALLERARALAPDEGRVLVNLGVVLTRSGRAEEAAKVLERAAELLPDDYRPHLNLAGLRLAAGDFEGALAGAERACVLAPQIAQCHALAGKALLQLQRVEEGLGRLEQAHGLDPGNLTWAAELSAAYLAAGDWSKARAAFEQIAKSQPEAWQPRADLASVCLELGDWAAARAALDEALRLAPDEPALAELSAALEAAEQK